MEYKEVSFKDGCLFKGMLKTLSLPPLGANLKKKHITGTGEFTLSDEGTIYKGALVKGLPHGFGEKFWP